MLKRNKKAFSPLSFMNFMVMGLVIIIGMSIIGPVAQELKNAACSSNESIPFLLTVPAPSTDISSIPPEGTTDSFGGAGSNRFGGYDGKVKHSSFLDAVASTSIVKTDKSVLNPDCAQLDPMMLFIIDNFTIIFISLLLLSGFGMWRMSASTLGGEF